MTETTDIVTRNVLGWKVATAGFPDGEARILDVELAQKLGFVLPRNIRNTIARFVETGVLPAVHMRSTVKRKRIGANNAEITYLVNEYWLTEDEALFVAARSDAAMGIETLVPTRKPH